MSSSLSRVNVEVSVSEALFPPTCSSVSFVSISFGFVCPLPVGSKKNKKKKKKLQNIAAL